MTFIFNLANANCIVFLCKLLRMNKIVESLNRVRHGFYGVAKVMAFVLAAVLVYWLLPRGGKFNYEYQMSKPWLHESLYAPFDFPIYKSDEDLRIENEAAVRNVKPVFNFDETAMFSACDALGHAFETQWDESGRFDKSMSLECLLHVFDTIENQGVVAYDNATENLTPESLVTVMKNKEARTMAYGDFYTTKMAEEIIEEMLAMASDMVDKKLVTSILKNGIRQNVFYSSELTRQLTEQALSSVSLTSGMVQKDELIIAEGEIVSEKSFAILNSLLKEYQLRSLSMSDSIKIWVSQFFLVAMVFALMALYLSILHKKVFAELRNINVLLLMTIMVVIPSYLIASFHPSYILMMPVSILAILVILFFDLRLAFAIQVFAVMLISLAVPNPFQFIFMQLSVTMVAIFSMSKQHLRHRFFFTALLVFATYTVVYLAFTMPTASEIRWLDVGMLGLNALFTMLAQPIVAIFERLFGFTTSLSLMELSNTNSPLLHELSNKAPGTFQHSIQVANLCEAVLIEIGGDSVLARTGAMYHDVGKLSNPMYFTENQQGKYNPHSDMSNEESAKVIISHVNEGIRLAHKAHVPERVIEFIRTHHGTRRTDYFYIMEQKEHPGEEIDPAPFTYHGPAPFSRETAVLMMCDSIEAASHSVKEPDEQKISDLVDNIINKQMETGQFLNTDLTLRDFETIRKVLKKKLMSIYHVRIAYPDK